MGLIEMLRVYDVHSPKIRLGNNFDGGYVINQLAIDYGDILVSLGSNREYSFEEDWIRYKPNSLIEIYDGTCACSNHFCGKYPQVTYIQKNIGVTEGTEHLSNILKNKSNVVLKVDIESAEYVSFDNVDLSNVVCLTLEIHNVNNKQNQQKLNRLFSNEFSTLTLFHLHANNWGDVFNLENYQIPTVIELSFINNKIIKEHRLDLGVFPIDGIDFPNHTGRPDIKLDWINKF